MTQLSTEQSNICVIIPGLSFHLFLTLIMWYAATTLKRTLGAQACMSVHLKLWRPSIIASRLKPRRTATEKGGKPFLISSALNFWIEWKESDFNNLVDDTLFESVNNKQRNAVPSYRCIRCMVYSEYPISSTHEKDWSIPMQALGQVRGNFVEQHRDNTSHRTLVLGGFSELLKSMWSRLFFDWFLIISPGCECILGWAPAPAQLYVLTRKE